MNRVAQLLLLILISPLSTMGQMIKYDSSLVVAGKQFRIQHIQLPHCLTILRIANDQDAFLVDTLNDFTDFELVDFDGDKRVDIIMRFMGNVDTQSLYLFDAAKGMFRKVKQFEKFPEAKKVDGSGGFYYSYHRSGCADKTWTSDLFKVIDYRVVHFGRIFGDRCKQPGQVIVYRINQDQTKSVLETLAYKLVEESRGHKWEFIENYWANNYTRFR